VTASLPHGSVSDRLPAFRPHPLVRGGHLQTLAGVFLPGPRFGYRARRHIVALADGDRIVLHDDCPTSWQPGDRVALLIHGLAGCHQSSYMARIAAKLERRGVRAFRLDLRGCGAGLGLARLPYHSGRSEDAAAALEKIAELCPRSPTALVGFSLGGNITLKLLGELGDARLANLDRAVAVCPPADLLAAVEQIRQPRNRLYERHFVRLLMRQLREQRRLLSDLPPLVFARPPRHLWQFDDEFTAPVCGFGRAINYYQQASAVRLVGSIRRPVLVIAAHDDPLVPIASLEPLRSCAAVEFEVTPSGGHLGFIGPRHGGDRRWLDGRVVEWVTRE
jgi:uncharacterized protein